jgi:PKD repeat protein
MGGYQDVIHSDSALLRISIVSGKGMGQYRRAVAHTPFSVTVDRPWLVQPDSTSIATISRLYVDNTLYKNDINAFPAGYDRVVGAQVAGYDGSIGIGAGNLWGLSMEGNVSHRTSTGWGIGIGQTSPQCWNELRDEKAYDCALNGFTMYTLMGEQGPGPGPLNCIGNVFRGGEVTVIGGSPIQTAVVGASVQNGIGSTFESITINAKRGIEYAGINGPAPYGTSVPSSYYGSAIFRKCNITVYNNPAFQPGVPQPVYFASYSDGQLLSRNTYSGSSQIYTGSGLTQTPVALGRCARFKGYVGGHLDPVVVPISNPGIQTMSWTATPSDSWITATIGASPTMAAEGDAGRLVVYVDASGMSAGRHWGYVTVSTGIKTAKIGVCVDLDAGPPAQQSPVASFTSSPAGGIAPVTANFDAGGSSDADGVIVSYSWDFGDGTGTAGVSASHTYSVAGVYLVTLTVTDNSGNTGIAVATITAGAPLTGVSISGNPAPPIESGTPVTLTATPIGGYNVSYKFLIRSGNGWSVLRDYSTDPAAAWTPSSSGCYAIRVLARSAGSANAYDVIGEIAYPVGLVPSAGMRLWLRADSGIGFDDLGKVSSWADQSGAGNNVSQSTESIRPAFVTNGFDGKPTVRFTGPSQMLQTSGLVLTGTTPFTAFTAAKFNSFPVGSYQYLWWNGMNSQTAGYGCYISTTVKLRSAWGSQSYYLTDTSSASAGTWYKMTSRYSSGSHQAWLNGTYLGSNAKTDSNFNLLGVFTVGNNGPTPSQGFYGDIGEILIYDRALSDTERANVETYLLSKWSPITAVTRERLLDVKALPDQTVVSITLPKVVTAASGVFSGGVYYICEPDRTCGLRVTGGPSVALWENVTLTGTVGTDANGERVLMVSTVDTRSSGTELGTLGMMNKVCGPSGQFVRVWGKVVGTGSGYFTLDDGSASPIRVETSGLIIPPSVIVQTGQYAGASGISGRGAGGLTVVRPRSDSDIRVY